MEPGRWARFFDVRKTLVAGVLALLLIALNLKWQESLAGSLVAKRDELLESLHLLNSKTDLKGKESELEALKALKSEASENWTDSIPAWVSDQKLILRQVRPMGIEQKGRFKEEKVFLQVDGNVDGLLGFLHHIAMDESSIYVSRYFITSRTAGSGFISVELVLSKMMIS